MNKGFLIIATGFCTSLAAGWFFVEVSNPNSSLLNFVRSNSASKSLAEEGASDQNLLFPEEKTSHPGANGSEGRKETGQPKSKSAGKPGKSYGEKKPYSFRRGDIVQLQIDKKMAARIDGLERGDKLDIGKLQTFDSQRFFFVSPEGKMLSVPGSIHKYARPTKKPFSRLNSAQMVEYLRKEFGSRFRILRSRFFILAISKNISTERAKFWAKKMDSFYTSLEAFFQIRGIALRKPKNTLVAMVFSSKKQMTKYADSVEDRIQPGYVAYYSSQTNRVALYDSPNTRLNVETVFHEATHQVLFNRGFHYRSIPAPRWLTEGIATAFEAPGLYDHRNQTSRSSRIQAYHLRRFQSLLNDARTRSKIVSLIKSNDLFEAEISNAYTISWAMTFYCLETQSENFGRFVQQVNRQDPFRRPGAKQRAAIFSRSMNQSPQQFAEDVIRFFKNSKNLR